MHPPGLEPGTHCFLVSDDENAGEDNVIALSPSETSTLERGGEAVILNFPAAPALEEVDAR